MDSLLQPPPPFCFEKDLTNVTSGNLCREWTKWKKSFMIYYKACQLDKKEREVQTSILLHVIGEKCRDVYEQFPEETSATTSVESLLKKFDGFFTPKKNLTIERHKFFTRNQQEHETVDQYAFDLNKLATSCEFEKLKDDLIKDRLICGLREDTLRERLLRVPDLTLKKTLDMCTVAEISRAQASTVKTEPNEASTIHAVEERDDPVSDLHWVRRENSTPCRCGARRAGGQRQQAWTGQQASAAGPSRQAAAASGASRVSQAVRAPAPRQNAASTRGTAFQEQSHGRGNPCNYCGRYHEKFQCPAYGLRCAKCNKLNHFAKVCRVYTVQDNSTDQVCSMRNIASISDEWLVDLQINNNNIRFKLDTGADANVLPFRFLSQTGVHQHDLLPTSTRLISYSGENLKVLGKCQLKVNYKNKPYIAKFIIVDVDSPPVLGKKSCAEMNLVRRVFTIDKQNKPISILDEYPEVCEGMGCLPGEYKIQLTSDAQPVVHAPRKLPVALRDDVKRKLDEMLQLKVIEKVEGPTDWVNSMTVVKKPNGDIRICLDPRDLNKYIKREHFKLPTLDEITSKLSGSKYFSTLDCKQSFWQTRLHNDSTDLCTFNTIFGRFKFLRMPFGISSASEVFHKRLFECFDDIQGVELFVDDLLVYASSKLEHDKRLRQVLERCKQINVKLNREKCKIGLTEIRYLGHIITQNGIRPDNAHILPILDMPKPENAKDLERFLGLVTYVGSFIPNLSDKTRVLRELLRKDIAWHWSEIHNKCLEELKQCMTNPPVLQYYSLDKPVTLSVDASKHGLGACLLQNGLPVCFASKSLTKTEQAYAQIEKELYACVFACEKFYTYIYGRSDITIETDHKPLVSIINKPLAGAPARLQRMLIRLQPYTFKLVYKPGRYLYIADTLSRAVAPSSGTASEPRDDLDVRAQVCAIATSNSLSDTHFIELQKHTSSDEEMQELIKIIKNGWPIDKNHLQDILKSYWDCRDELTVEYELVWKGERIVIPKCMRRDMLKRIHIGHLGAAKTKLRAREIMYWPNMNSQIQDMVSHCQACLTHRKENSKQPLIPHEIPNRAWSKVGTDVFHCAGKSYLLVIDYFSKFVEVEKLINLTSEHIIGKLKGIFCRQGVPDVVMSDNGPEFSSRQFKEFSHDWKFQHKTSSPRYPQSNGQVERAIQTIKSMYKKTSYDGSDFRLALLEFLNTPISETLPSPAELLNSRKYRSIVPCPPRLLEPKIHRPADVSTKLQLRQSTQKKYYDKGSKNLKPLLVGDKIKVRIEGKWINGVINGLSGLRSYTLKLCSSGKVIRRNRRQIILDSPLRQEQNAMNESYDFDDVIQSDPTSSSAPLHSDATHSAAAAAVGSYSNNYVTRFGRTVRPPDRWRYT